MYSQNSKYIRTPINKLRHPGRGVSQKMTHDEKGGKQMT